MVVWLRLLSLYFVLRRVCAIVSPSHTDEPLYSSNSLESSSISVYATLMCDNGRSSDDRAVRAVEKND